MPLTIAIIQALLVEVQRSIFAIPPGLSSKPSESRSRTSRRSTVGKSGVSSATVLPLIRLAQEFDVPHEIDRDRSLRRRGYIADWRVGIVVDELRSQEEVVIKSILDYLETVKGVSGATIVPVKAKWS
ncbi:MAG: hypothetical protein U0361_03160 [Nitrospiraceae bacterium]